MWSTTKRCLASVAAGFGLALILFGCVSAEEQVAAEKVTVGAYYYPWYRAPRSGDQDAPAKRGWLRQALRGRLQPPQLPELGIYDSRSEEVVGRHIAQSVRGNIDVWGVSWWGPDTMTDRTFREAILPHPDAKKLKYAVLYESTDRLGAADKPDYSRLLPDFEYFAKHYFDHPQYYRIDGKPVVFIYLTRVYFRDRGGEALAELRRRFPQVYLIGDEIFGPHLKRDHVRQWDAVTAYDVYGQSFQRDGATRDGLATLQSLYQKARDLAHDVETAFVPAVSPGFNDRAVRDGHVGRPRYLTDLPQSREGDLFRRQLTDIALPMRDPAADQLIMVTSFNEWYEDTQIEPTSGSRNVTDADDSDTRRHYTQGDRYDDYGTLYLDILHEVTRK